MPHALYRMLQQKSFLDKAGHPTLETLMRSLFQLSFVLKVAFERLPANSAWIVTVSKTDQMENLGDV